MTTSFLIPCYNEELRLKANFKVINKFVKMHTKDEFIFIDDGSSDKTISILNKYKSQNKNVIILKNKINLGKGAAIKNGVMNSSKDTILFLDADLSTPLSEIPKALKYLKTNNIVIGVRKHKMAKIVKHQPLYREFMGKAFTLFANKILLKNIHDATCGFKGFHSKCAKRIFLKTRINRWVFDVEVLFLAQKFHYKIKQMPVVWENDENTRVSIIRDSVVSARDLLLIKFYDFTSKY